MLSSLELILPLSLAIAILSTPAEQSNTAKFEFSVNKDGVAANSLDRLVPADARGVISSFGGHTWWQALTYCHTIHAVEARRLESNGETAHAEQAKLKADQYLQQAVVRFGTDRRVVPDLVVKLLGPEFAYQELSILDAGHPYVQEAARCRLVEIHHARSAPKR